MSSRPDDPWLAFFARGSQPEADPWDDFFGGPPVKKVAAATPASVKPNDGLPRLSAPAPVAADATRVALEAPRGTPEQVEQMLRTTEAMGLPTPPVELPRNRFEGVRRLTQPPVMQRDITALANVRAASSEPPTMRAMTQAEIDAQKERKRQEAEREAATARYHALTDIPGIPGSGPIVRTGLAAGRGVANAVTLGHLEEGVDLANRGVARVLGKDAPPSVETTFDNLNRSTGEKAAEVGGFIYGAGSMIGAQNRLLGRLGERMSSTTGVGNAVRRALQSFNPAQPVSRGVAAAQTAVESLPYDLAYDADTPGQRAANVAAGVTLGAALGPVFRNTTPAPDQPTRFEGVRRLRQQREAPLAERSTVQPPGPALPAVQQAETASPAKPIPSPAPERQTASIAEVPTASLRLAPERFQFKLGTDASGVTQELKSVQKFDPDLAGVVQVWRDPADGELYVINGHHRVELAQRTGHPSMAVRFVNAPDAGSARQIGALTNIAEGRGTAVDAAKLFRESGIGPEQLEARGISLRGALAREGTALWKLHPSLFGRVVNGELPVQRAAAIGNAGLDGEQQLALSQMLEKQERGGRRLTNEAIGELVRFVKDAGETEVTQATLFGEEVMKQSLALEKAELSAYVKERLAKDRRLFGFLTRAGRAGRIEESGAGRIETGRASEIAEGAAQAEEVYHALSAKSGPIAQALNDAARELAAGANAGDIREALYTRVREAVEFELSRLGRTEAPAGGRDVAAGSVRPDQPAAEAGFFDPLTGVTRPNRFAGLARLRESDALEVQPDMFGGPAKVTGEAQGALFGAESAGTLKQAEQRARQTVALLRNLVQSGRANPKQTEQYREALALLRRGEGMSAEEVGLRATREQAPAPESRELFDKLFDSPTAEGVHPDAIIPRESDQLRDRTLSGRLPGERQIAVGKALQAGESLDVPDRRQLLADMAEALGIPFRVGKFKGKGVLGIYKRIAEVARSKIAQDVEVFSHEGVGHHVHKMLFGLNKSGSLAQKPLQPYAAELRPLSYDDSLKEGLAEFMRLRVTNPDVAAKAAPQFNAFMEGKLKAEWPEVLEMIEDAGRRYKLWAEAPAQARIEAQIARPSTEKAQTEFVKIMSPWDRARTRALDDLLPLRVLTRQGRRFANLGGTVKDDIAADAGTLADLARGSAGQAELFIEHGAVDFNTRRRVGHSLREVFDPIRQDGKLTADRYEAFRRYAISKRADYLYRTRKDIAYLGIEHGDATKSIEELESPEFMEALERFHVWNDHLMKWLVDAGVVSENAAKRIRARNQIYVPLMRERDPGLAGIGNRGLLNKKDPIKRLKGSGRQILDPFEESIKRAYEYTRLAAKQQVSNAIVELAKKPGMGKLIEQVDAPTKAMKMPTGDVLQQLAHFLGLTSEDVKKAMASGQLPDFLMVHRPSDFLEENMISVLQKGRRVFYEVDPALYRSLQGLDGEQIGTLTKIAAIPARTLRAGATLAPEFALRNPIRDQLMAGVQSEWGYVPFVDLARGVASLLKKDEYWHAFMSGGGSRSTLLGLDRATIRSHAQKALQVKGDISNVIQSPRDALGLLDRLLDPLRRFSETMEDATRIGETRRALDTLRSQGVPEGEAAQRAAKAGREVSIDFARHGLEGARLRAMTAFWNAQIQGYDRLARAFKADPAGTTLRSMAMITVPSVLEYLVYRDDPEYFEIPQWQRDLFWVFKAGDSWWRVPKPFELGIVFGSIPQRVLEWMDQHDPEGVDKLVKETLAQQAVRLAPIPTFMSPLIDNFANYSRFLERPIVPRGLENVDPAEQYTRETSEVSKGLGRMLGMSPAKLDNLLFSYTGGLGRLAVQGVDLAAEGAGIREKNRFSRLSTMLPGVKGFAVRDPGASSESIERLYAERGRAESAFSTLQKLQREGRMEEAARYREEHLPTLAKRRQLASIADELAEDRKLLSAIDRSGLSADEKRKRREAIERRMLLRAATAVRSREHVGELAKMQR